MELCGFKAGLDQPFFLIAGPCVIESRQMAHDTAGELKRITSALGILDRNEGVALRATFIVDPEGVIRFASVNDLNVGRNPQEVLRVLDALQTDELCPCNWKPGQQTLN